MGKYTGLQQPPKKVSTLKSVHPNASEPDYEDDDFNERRSVFQPARDQDSEIPADHQMPEKNEE